MGQGCGILVKLDKNNSTPTTERLDIACRKRDIMFILDLLSALEGVTFVENLVLLPFPALLRGAVAGSARRLGAPPPVSVPMCCAEVRKDCDGLEAECVRLEGELARTNKKLKKLKKKIKRLKG